MPSYPASVFAPTNKITGEVIAAGHINDAQDEIVAIEGGLLNGTARLNSSNSTVNSLSVSSGSTFTLRPTMPPPDFALVYRESTATIGSSADSTIAWNAESLIVNSSMHSTVTNPERLIPQSTGVYQFTAQIGFSAVTTGGERAMLLRDSSAGVFGSMRLANSTVALESRYNFAGYKRFDVVGATQYAVVTISLSNQTTLSLSSGLGITFLAMTKL